MKYNLTRRMVIGFVGLTLLSIIVGYLSAPRSSEVGKSPASLVGSVNSAGTAVLTKSEPTFMEAIARRGAKRGEQPPFVIPPLSGESAKAWEAQTAEQRRKSAIADGESSKWSIIFSGGTNSALTTQFLAARKDEFIVEATMADLPTSYKFTLSEFLLIVDNSPKQYAFGGQFLTREEKLTLLGVQYNVQKDCELNLAAHVLARALSAFPDETTRDSASARLKTCGWNLIPDDFEYAFSKVWPGEVRAP